MLKRLLPMQWSIMPFFRQLLGQARVHGAFGGSPSWVVIMDRGMKSFRLAAVSFPRYDHRLPLVTKTPPHGELLDSKPSSKSDATPRLNPCREPGWPS